MGTKVYFYGETKEEAKESNNHFLSCLTWRQLATLDSLCCLNQIDWNPPLPYYKFRYYCEFTKFSRKKKEFSSGYIDDKNKKFCIQCSQELCSDTLFCSKDCLNDFNEENNCKVRWA